MQRRNFLTLAFGAGLIVLVPKGLAAAGQMSASQHQPTGRAWDLTPLSRDPEYWRAHVSPPAWRVLFQERTEPSHSSALNAEWRDGTYLCAACLLPLFSSDAKYESDTGWPSFYQPFDGHVGTKLDFKLLWPRTEYHCVRCGGHQGHVFKDGPPPTGKRWCNNGLALTFVPAEEPLPALRG